MSEDSEAESGAGGAASSLPSTYARGLFDHFVTRRARGTDLSSQDVHLLLGWEAEGIPEGWVVEGIDVAFAKLREAPASISECRRYVLKVVEARRERPAEASAEGGADGSTGQAPEAGLPAPFCADEPGPLRQLRLLCRHPRAEVAAASERLCEKLRLMPAEALVSFEVLLGLELRLEEAVVALLPDEEQEALEEEAQRMLRRERRGADAAAARRARTRAYRALLEVPPLS
jgi:hypothetical protein